MEDQTNDTKDGAITTAAVVENGAITDLATGEKVTLEEGVLRPVEFTTDAAVNEHPAHSVLRDMENEINALGSYALTVLRPFLEKIRNVL